MAGLCSIREGFEQRAVVRPWCGTRYRLATAPHDVTSYIPQEDVLGSLTISELFS